MLKKDGEKQTISGTKKDHSFVNKTYRQLSNPDIVYLTANVTGYSPPDAGPTSYVYTQSYGDQVELPNVWNFRNPRFYKNNLRFDINITSMTIDGLSTQGYYPRGSLILEIVIWQETNKLILGYEWVYEESVWIYKPYYGMTIGSWNISAIGSGGGHETSSSGGFSNCGVALSDIPEQPFEIDNPGADTRITGIGLGLKCYRVGANITAKIRCTNGLLSIL